VLPHVLPLRSAATLYDCNSYKNAPSPAIDLALAGDATALRLCMDRILPALRERPVTVELPSLTGPQDAVAASAALLAAVAAGEIAPGEAREFGRLLELHLKAVEQHELEARLAALEAAQK
jgi:hypothetical protein